MQKGAVAFRHNRIKNRGIVKRSQYPFEMNHKFEEIKVENLRFSSFFIVFYSFSPLSRRMYIRLRGENEEFCSKSIRPTVLFSLRIR